MKPEVFSASNTLATASEKTKKMMTHLNNRPKNNKPIFNRPVFNRPISVARYGQSLLIKIVR